MTTLHPGNKENAVSRRHEPEASDSNEARLNALMEHSNDVIWEVDRQGVLTYCSPNVRRIAGYEPQELVGKTTFDLMPAADAHRFKGLFGAMVTEGKQVSRIEHRILYKDGRTGQMECCVMSVYDKQGVFQGYRGIDREINPFGATSKSAYQSPAMHQLSEEEMKKLSGRLASHLYVSQW